MPRFRVHQSGHFPDTPYYRHFVEGSAALPLLSVSDSAPAADTHIHTHEHDHGDTTAPVLLVFFVVRIGSQHPENVMVQQRATLRRTPGLSGGSCIGMHTQEDVDSTANSHPLERGSRSSRRYVSHQNRVGAR